MTSRKSGLSTRSWAPLSCGSLVDRASSMPPKKPRALTKRKQGAHHASGAPKDGKLVAVKRSKHTPVEEFVHVVENKQWVRRDRSSLANSSRKKGSVPAPARHRGARADRPAACSLPGTPFEQEQPLELPLRRGSSTGECLETRTQRARATAEFLASASAVPPETAPSAGRAAADALSASLAAAEARIRPEEEGAVTRRRAAECGAQMAERREQLEREQLALDHAAQRAIKHRTIYARTHTSTHARARARTHPCTHPYTLAPIHTSTRAPIHARTHACTHPATHARMHRNNPRTCACVHTLHIQHARAKEPMHAQRNSRTLVPTHETRTHACAHARAHAHMHTLAYSHTHSRTQPSIHTCTHPAIHACVGTCVRIYLCVHGHAHPCICAYACVLPGEW